MTKTLAVALAGLLTTASLPALAQTTPPTLPQEPAREPAQSTTGQTPTNPAAPAMRPNQPGTGSTTATPANRPAAQAPQMPNRPMTGQSGAVTRPGSANTPGMNTTHRPYMSEPGVQGGMQGSGMQGSGTQGQASTYGRWETNWGPQPPAPPSGYANTSNWYAHVRACQQRYKSYNPRTDTFVPRAGQTARCTL